MKTLKDRLVFEGFLLDVIRCTRSLHLAWHRGTLPTK